MPGGTIRAGDLRHRVTLRRLPDPQSADTFGQLESTPVAVGTYWAAIRPASGREIEIGKQMQSEVDHVVTMRYVGPIGPTDDLTFGTRVFAIVQALLVDEVRNQYTLYCREQDSGLA